MISTIYDDLPSTLYPHIRDESGEHILETRSSMCILRVSWDVITIDTYNWSTELFADMEASLERCLRWIKVRAQLLNVIMMRKMRKDIGVLTLDAGVTDMFEPQTDGLVPSRKILDALVSCPYPPNIFGKYDKKSSGARLVRLPVGPSPVIGPRARRNRSKPSDSSKRNDSERKKQKSVPVIDRAFYNQKPHARSVSLIPSASQCLVSDDPLVYHGVPFADCHVRWKKRRMRQQRLATILNNWKRNWMATIRNPFGLLAMSQKRRENRPTMQDLLRIVGSSRLLRVQTYKLFLPESEKINSRLLTLCCEMYCQNYAMQVVVTEGAGPAHTKYLRKIVDGNILIACLSVKMRCVKSTLYAVDFDRIWPAHGDATRRTIETIPQSVFGVKSDLSVSSTIHDFHVGTFYNIKHEERRDELARNVFEFALASGKEVPPDSSFKCCVKNISFTWSSCAEDSPSGTELLEYVVHTASHFALEVCAAAKDEAYVEFGLGPHTRGIANCISNGAEACVEVSLYLISRSGHIEPAKAVSFLKSVLSQAKDLYTRGTLWTNVNTRERPFNLRELKELMRVSKTVCIDDIDPRLQQLLDADYVNWKNLCAHLVSIYKSRARCIPCKHHHHALIIDGPLIFHVRVSKEGREHCPKVDVVHQTGFDAFHAVGALAAAFSDIVGAICHYSWNSLLN